jgi:hypothetical protein
VSAQNVSHEQLAMYMTPEEIKEKYAVRDPEYHDHELTDTEVYNRKKEESKKIDIEGWPKTTKKGQESLFSHIQKHGVSEPVNLNVEDKEVIDGHHRIASAPSNSLIPVEYGSN